MNFVLAQCIWKSELQDNNIASDQFWIEFIRRLIMYGKPSFHDTMWSGPYTCIIQYDSKTEFSGKVYYKQSVSNCNEMCGAVYTLRTYTYS